jgi:hypothetical protein
LIYELAYKRNTNNAQKPSKNKGMIQKNENAKTKNMSTI